MSSGLQQTSPSSGASAAAHYLTRMAGPPLETLVLDPAKSPLTLGRHEECDLQTDIAEERVSRFHARFTYQGGMWYVSDLKSTWGTYLNGYRLPPEQPHLLSEGDLVRITPWTLSFRRTVSRGVMPQEDSGPLSIRSVLPERMSGDPLVTLVEAAAGIHQAADEQTLAALLVEFGRSGTGYTAAAYLKPTDADGRIETIAAVPQREQVYSRSLLQMASTGQMAVLDGSLPNSAQSIIQMQISSALCVPLMLGGAVAAYLYVDLRQQHARVNPRAAEYCLALARIGSLALANLKRIEIERRQAAMNAQLEQAGMIQRFLLPQGQQTLGTLLVTGASRPGQMLGGDFYDVIPLGESRVALTLGDVSGKGITASVLMTTIHGFVHALLEDGVELVDVVTRLNAFLEPRKPVEQFATMFAAVMDCARGEITYVDAGHGYGLLWRGGNATWLHDGGGPPLGISRESKYSSGKAAFAKGDSLVIVSDGIIEQTAPGSRTQFEAAGVEQALAGESDELSAIMAAVERHAGTSSLADDATILVAHCRR